MAGKKHFYMNASFIKGDPVEKFLVMTGSVEMCFLEDDFYGRTPVFPMFVSCFL